MLRNRRPGLCLTMCLGVAACGSAATKGVSGNDGGGSASPDVGDVGSSDAGDADSPASTDVGTTDAGTTPTGTTKIGEALANHLMTAWPDLNTCTGKDWEYTNGIVYAGIARLYEKNAKPEYLAYVKTFVDKYVNAAGAINYANVNVAAMGTMGCVAGQTSPATANPNPSSRDTRIQDVWQPSNLLFTVYQSTKDARYLTAMTATRKLFSTIQKNSLGGFFHKPTYPYQMWLDGSYMSEPFLARYGSTWSTMVDPSGADQTDAFATVTLQLKLLAEKTMDRTNTMAAKRLPVHAWADLAGLTTAGQQPPTWANATTGQSPTVWTRAVGWYAMALVDVLTFLPQNHADFPALKSILNDIAAGLKATQDSSTGLWFQVTDQGGQADNWIETSGSAMLAYALKRGVNAGWLDADFEPVAARAWVGVKSKVAITGSTVTVHGSVGGMSVQNDYAGYVSKMSLVADNVPHGLAAVLLAASEFEY